MEKTKGLLAFFLLAVPLIVAAAVSPPGQQATEEPVPSPALDPGEVVRIQVAALRTNSPLNEGIELTYRFASPENKRSTGPLPRFVEMVRSAPYDRLLNHRSARYSPVVVSGNEAHQVVLITDRNDEQFAYHWLLSRQSQGEFKNCWMTNAVIPAQRLPQREFVEGSLHTTDLEGFNPDPIAARSHWLEQFAKHKVRLLGLNAGVPHGAHLTRMSALTDTDS